MKQTSVGIGSILSLATIVVAVIFLFPDLAFASEESTMKDTFEIYDIVLRFLSWVRIVPAALVGKLLSNDLVFGGMFNLEIYLWKMWTVMRNFANFFVGGLFLYFLFAQIINSIQGASIGEFMKKIVKLLIAALLINMSFFLIRAVVDVSIVATAAVSSLPHHVIQGRWDEIKNKVPVKKGNCIENFMLVSNSANCDHQEKKTLGISTILPDANNMGRPILFMGVAMLDLLSADVVPVDIKNRENIALVTVAKVVLIILFTIPLLVLMVVNMLRIFLIRLWTIFSPFIIIDIVMGEDSPTKGLGEMLKYEKLSNLLGLIFTPVIVVGTLSLGFILMLGLMSVVKGGEEYVDRSVSNIQIQGGAAETTLAVPHVVNVGIQGSLFQRTAFRTLGFFGEALMVFFAMAILWGMVKVGFSFNTISKSVSDKMFGFAGSLLKSVPIVPIAGGLSASTISNKGIGGLMGDRLGVTQKLRQSDANAENRFNTTLKKFGYKGSDLGYDDISASNLSQVSSGTIQQKISRFPGAISKDATSLKYKGNVKTAFDAMTFDDLKGKYLGGGITAENYKTSQGYVDFMKAVVNGDDITQPFTKTNAVSNIEGIELLTK